MLARILLISVATGSHGARVGGDSVEYELPNMTQDIPVSSKNSFAEVLRGRPIVIDNGRGTMLAGFADETAFRTKEILEDGIVEHGIVKDWEKMEEIWTRTFEKLNVKPEEHPVVVTEVVQNPTANSEHMVKTFFDNFHVPELYVSWDARLSLISSGRHEGLVVDVGIKTTTVTAFYSAKETGKKQASAFDLNFGVQDIKEWLSQIDGDVEFFCPEQFFQPSAHGVEAGLHTQIDEKLRSLPELPINELYENVVFSAEGITRLNGLVGCLKQELQAIAQPQVNVEVDAVEDWPVWVGGSMVEKQDKAWITAKEYESDTSIGDRKFRRAFVENE